MGSVVELILTGTLVPCVIGLQVLTRRLKRDPDTIYELLAIAVCLLLVIWAPSYVRSIAVGGFLVFAMLGLGLGMILTMLVLVVATAIWLPGGVSMLSCGILALVGIGQIRSARAHLIRLSRATTLVTNQQVEDEVELTGAVHAVHPTVDPVFGEPCAMWRVRGEGLRESDTMVEIRSSSGSALIDPTSVRIEWSRQPKVVSGDEAKRAAELLRVEPVKGALMLNVLPEGAECYVVGTPTWETAPASTIGLYRDSHLLPTFRSTPEHRALFADRSEAQLRGDHAWAMASWGTWSVVCAAISVLQIGGWS